MMQVGVLALCLLVSPLISASPIVINDPSILPAIDSKNGFTSTPKVDLISVSLPQSQDLEVKFGYPTSHKSTHRNSPVPEFYGPVIPPKVPDFTQRPLVLVHNPAVLPKEEIPSVEPLIPQAPVFPVIPVTEEVPQKHPHKHRRPHVPKRKHVPHGSKPRCECEIPFIPDTTKPQRRHHEPKHSCKTEKRHHLHHNQDKI